MPKQAPRPIGATGLRYASGKVVEDQPSDALRFPRSLKTYQRMRADPIIAGSLFMIKQFIRKVDWSVEPKGGIEATDSAKEKANIVSDALFMHMERSFDQLMSDMCSFIENGFGFHEPTFKIDENGNIVWRDFPARPPSSIKGFKFDKHGYVTHVEQYRVNTSFDGKNTNLYSTSTKEIPYKRLLHFRTDSEKNNPLGRSILNNAYESWFYKSKLQEHEAIGVEREMNGLPRIKIPSEYFAADKDEDPEKYAVLQEFVRIGTNARSNEQACVIIPSDTDESGKALFEFDLIASSGTRSLDTSKIIDRYDFRIAQSLLNDFLLMGSSSTGSFALSDNKVNTFVQSLEAYLEVISEQFNRKAIPQLFELNGWDKEDLCKLVHKPISAPTLSEIADMLQKGDGYITPDKTFENWLRGEIGAPDRDEDKAYIDKPVSSHQADSQRIGMTASAQRNGVDASKEDLEELEKSLKQSVDGTYIGES